MPPTVSPLVYNSILEVFWVPITSIKVFKSVLAIVVADEMLLYYPVYYFYNFNLEFIK